MDAALFRKALAGFLGPEEFRKFVGQLRRSERLRYWQERAWERFEAAHPEHRLGPDELLLALRICEIHGDELQPDAVKIVEGCVYYADEYMQAKFGGFPNSAFGSPLADKATIGVRTVDVWYCSACRRAEAVWHNGKQPRRVKSDVQLSGLVTLDEYEVARGYRDLAGLTGERWCAFRSEIEAELAEGGDLWEWVSTGFRFPGEGGLAVVGGGEVVRCWVLPFLTAGVKGIAGIGW